MIFAQVIEPRGAATAGAPVGFQIVALTALGVLLLLTIAAGWFKKATRRETAFWSLVWLAAAVAIVRYDWTMVVAGWLGIGRGADLLLYCAVGVMMLGFMMTYHRLCRLRREITLITRHLALSDAQRGPSNEKQKN